MYVEGAYAKIAAENFKIHRHYFFIVLLCVI